MTTRRTFLQTSTLAVAAAMGRSSQIPVSTSLHTIPRERSPNDLPCIGDPDFKTLALRALDAAQTAGATYADVRFTTTRRRTFTSVPSTPMIESEVRAVGVRALANGAWGFAAHVNETPEMLTQLGRMAAEQAQANAWPQVPPIALAHQPPGIVGHWQTPIQRDPFTVPVAEIEAFIHDLNAPQLHVVLTFERQDRTFVSTEGAYVTQTVYTSLGGTPHTQIPPSHILVNGYAVPFVSPCGAGYEVLEDAQIRDHIPEWIELGNAIARANPFRNIGPYDVVFDAYAMAALVNSTIGEALEYDRAVGYEANSGGTTYLAPPEKILGTALTPGAVTITADRTMPRGAATVGWDDEGVAPRVVPLIQAGVVVDYATSREFAPELAPWYHQRGQVIQSNGCAASESALTVPLVRTPNLELHAAADAVTFDGLLAGIENGLAVLGGNVRMDFQQITGLGSGAQVYAIKKGRLAGPVAESVYAFRSKDLWKNLVALGGAQTAAMRGFTRLKGSPGQSVMHSVKAVAARFQQINIELQGE